MYFDINKWIILLGVILTGGVFWVGAGMPAFSTEDWGKLYDVVKSMIANQ